MNKSEMKNAFARLDQKLSVPVRMLLGGGWCMVLVYNFPLATHNLDAVIYKSSVTLVEVAPLIAAVAQELNLPSDWLNPYFETFLYSLPDDYEKRLVSVFSGKFLQVNGLGAEDLLILKCFAGRDKDIPHARALIKRKPDLDLVYGQIYKLIDKNIPKAVAALDFLDDLMEELS